MDALGLVIGSGGNHSGPHPHVSATSALVVATWLVYDQDGLKNQERACSNLALTRPEAVQKGSKTDRKIEGAQDQSGRS